MITVTAEYAGSKIGEYLDAFGEYLDSPVGRVKQLRNPALREAVRILIKIKDSEGVKEALAGGGPHEQLEQFYMKCTSLLKAYRIDGIVPDGMETVKVRKGNSETVEKLLAQVRKFGDSRMAERLAEIESGESVILFAEMDEGTEGCTKVEDGQVQYRLNKRYELASDEDDLQKASIVLAHELQRNPATGNLKGETSEIVLRDVGFIERLAGEYGEGVYEKNPEFGVLHYIKELLGENGLREFAEIVFSHEGSYWRINDNGDLVDDATAEVKNADGEVLASGGGRQGVLAEWLGMESNDVYTHLMQPAGYTYAEDANGNLARWLNTPGIRKELLVEVLGREAYEKLGIPLEAVATTNPAKANLIICALEWCARSSTRLANTISSGINDIIGRIGSLRFPGKRAENAEPEATQTGYVTIQGNTEDILAFYQDLGKTAQSDKYIGKFTGETVSKDGKEWEKSDTFCNFFLRDMIGEHFGVELRDKIFGVQPIQRANDIADTFAGNTDVLERVQVRTDSDEISREDLAKIQAMADNGELVLVAFKNTNGLSGHLAFVGHSELTLSIKAPVNSQADHEAILSNDGEKASDVSGISLVIVHAGTYSGVTGISLGTNGWNNEETRKTLLENSIRFYRVKRN